MTDSRLLKNDARQVWGLQAPGLGVALGGAHDAAQIDRNREWAVFAEQLGLHSAWLPEMHFVPGACSTPLLSLAEIAGLTRNLRLGTTSLLLPLHPAESMAAEIAALDRMSGGRLLIGLGRGFQKRMLEAFGVDPAQKRDRFDEALDRFLTLWAEGNAQGNAFATAQKPHPPLAVAAFGPKGLAQAARRALPYLASPVESMTQLEENQAHHRSLLPESSPEPLSIVMRTVFVSETPSECAAALESLDAEASRRAGSIPKAVSRAMDAPMAERVVVGDPTEVLERLRADRARLGIDLLIVRTGIARVPMEAQKRSLALLAESIWPKV